MKNQITTRDFYPMPVVASERGSNSPFVARNGQRRCLPGLVFLYFAISFVRQVLPLPLKWHRGSRCFSILAEGDQSVSQRADILPAFGRELIQLVRRRFLGF